MSSQVFSLDEAATRVGFTRRSLDRLRSVGEGPPEIKLSPRRIVVLEADLEIWLKARRRPAPGKAA